MSVPLSHRNIALSKDELIKLFLQYEKNNLSLKNLSQYLHLCERQAKRRYERWKKDGTLFPKRGYGCKIPYSSNEFLDIVAQMYNNPNSHPVHAKDISNSSLLRHYRNMTYPSKCYLLSYIPQDVIVLSFEILGKRIKDSKLHIVVTIIINTINHTVNYKNVRIENSPILLYCDNCPEYNDFTRLLFKRMSCTYFQQLKMRNMDRLDDLSRLNAYTDYYKRLLTSMKDNLLYEAINSISNVAINKTNILTLPRESLYMLKSIVCDKNLEENEDTNKFEFDIQSKSNSNDFNFNHTNWFLNNMGNEYIKTGSHPLEQDYMILLKNNKNNETIHCNNRIVPTDPQFGDLTILVSDLA